jgi:hypothetical protein
MLNFGGIGNEDNLITDHGHEVIMPTFPCSTDLAPALPARR